EGKRLDSFLAEYSDHSRSRLHGLIKDKEVLLNGASAKPSSRLKAGDKIKVYVPEAESTELSAENIPLDIYYEDNELVVVNKPRGMVVHPAPGHSSGTLVNALMYHCKDSLSGINGEIRPGIVHRIDKDTSGLLMVAKTDSAAVSLSSQLACHSITRIYYALAHNNFKEDKGTIDKPVARHKTERKKMAVDPSGRRAVTHFEVLERFGRYTFLKLRLETGRTHQIRVHMAHMGHPLLGDMVYGPKKDNFKLEGQMLHAGVLGFIHPLSGEYMEFNAPLPDYFEKTLQKLRKLSGCQINI
ncbi:MAG: RluA family pseudouridine synthase, partial [Firmicutes bacterium]|nr:RluA family pseudouridine synthase [Bacillota bacterium]